MAKSSKTKNPRAYPSKAGRTGQVVKEGAAAFRVVKGSASHLGALAVSKEAVLVNAGRPEFTLSPFEKMVFLEKGISKKALEIFKEKAALDYDQLARVLNVARATLISKKGNETFNTDVSDKLLGLADIYSYGYEVFEDKDHFNQWIFSSNRALGNQAPFDILHNSFGREEVKNLIGRIDHGVYS